MQKTNRIGIGSGWPNLAATALLTVLIGCNAQTRRFESGGQPIAPDKPVATAPADRSMTVLLPEKIDVLPFTKPASFDDDAVPDGLEVVLRPLDELGDQTKAVGTFRFETYAFHKASTDPRGPRLGIWEVDLSTPEAQKEHWDAITRTYRFRLGWAGEKIQPGKYVLEVTYISPWGDRLNAVHVLEAQMPRGLIKERVEQRQRQGLF
ncbi:MAG: hypothetical protein GXY33_07490 [Phycisphaerae bacterium]|nr:hypothetical protein [Phycisphaerae bacterium]